MRLIDDIAIKIDVWDLFNSVYNDASRFTEEETIFAKRILSEVQEKIESQPTAYDVDKVVKQLKNGYDIVNWNEPYGITLDKAERIVKGGGNMEGD